MTSSTTEHNLFRPVAAKPLAKSDITTLASRAITDSEAEYRNAKTNRLRIARLAIEALTPPSDGKVKRTAKKTSAAAGAKTRRIGDAQ